MRAEPAIRTVVVQPEASSSGTLRKLLRARGHAVTGVADWEAGWAGLENSLPEFVLFALAPDSDLSRAYCSRLRGLPGGSGVFLAALAGNGGAVPAALVSQCALDDVIAAPFSLPELDVRLTLIESRILERRRRAGAALGISAPVQAEEGPQAIQARLQTILDAIPHDVFLKDRAGVFTAVNKAMERTFGRSAAAMLGRQVATPGQIPEAERADIVSSDRAALEEGRTVERVLPRTMPNGELRHYRVIKTPVRDAAGAVTGLVGIAENITERLAAENELRASQRLLRAVFDTIPHALWVKDREGRFLAVNERMARRFGRRPEDYIGLAMATLFAGPDDERQLVLDTDQQVLQEGRQVELERMRTHAQGETRLERVLKHPLRDEAGRIIGLVGMAEDITERRRSEDALRQSQALLQTVFDTVPHMMFVKDRDSQFVLVNKAMERAWGLPPEDMLGASTIAAEHRPAREIEAALRGDRTVFESKQALIATYPVTLLDGRARLLRVIKSPIFDAQGNVTGLVGVGEDITEPVQALNELRASQRLLRTLIDALPQSIYFKDAGGRYQLVNEAMARAYGMHPDQFTGRTLTDPPFSTPEELERKIATGAEAVQRGEPVEVPEILVSLAGQSRWERGVKVPVRGPDGTHQGIVGIFEDITERKRVQDELRSSQRLLQAVIDALPQAITVKGLDKRYSFVNQTNVDWFGIPRERFIGQLLESLGFSEQEFLAGAVAGDAAVLASGKAAELPDMTMRFNDGAAHWVHTRKVPLAGEDGALEGILTIMDDVTARKQAEGERLELERKVLHTQKLESLGILAGGIAHDFNNLLTGVLGNVELAELDTGKGHPAAPALDNIRQASLRAAVLTHQMLAYSGRGHYQNQEVNLNSLATDTTQLLRVSISKQIALRFDLAREAPTVQGDPAQLQQVVVNLITNAAEAIGDAGGEIHLATGMQTSAREDLAESRLVENHRDGPYAFLEVTDNGSGMTDEVKARIFDPFFSTKFTGRGLGLAAVLGIVRAHRGLIRIRGAPGAGSSFRVLFPPVEKAGA